MHAESEFAWPQYRITRHSSARIPILQKSHNASPPYRDRMTFGRRLRDRRKALGMSGEHLGAALGEGLSVKKQTLSHCSAT